MLSLYSSWVEERSGGYLKLSIVDLYAGAAKEIRFIFLDANVAKYRQGEREKKNSIARELHP